MSDPTITINGIRLSPGQVMTIYVALSNFAIDLTGEKFPLGDDEHGRAMTEAYLHAVRDIQKMYIKEARR